MRGEVSINRVALSCRVWLSKFAILDKERAIVIQSGRPSAKVVPSFACRRSDNGLRRCALIERCAVKFSIHSVARNGVAINRATVCVQYDCVALSRPFCVKCDVVSSYPTARSASIARNATNKPAVTVDNNGAVTSCPARELISIARSRWSYLRTRSLLVNSAVSVD